LGNRESRYIDFAHSTVTYEKYCNVGYNKIKIKYIYKKLQTKYEEKCLLLPRKRNVLIVDAKIESVRKIY
jgi:hypothetical protein